VNKLTNFVLPSAFTLSPTRCVDCSPSKGDCRELTLTDGNFAGKLSRGVRIWVRPGRRSSIVGQGPAAELLETV